MIYDSFISLNCFSCVTWSAYHKGLLASSDYEGTVTLWDAFTGTKSRLFQEHEKRCWSVDFNRMDPKLLASGSDDAKGERKCMQYKKKVFNDLYVGPQKLLYQGFRKVMECDFWPPSSGFFQVQVDILRQSKQTWRHSLKWGKLSESWISEFCEACYNRSSA